MSFVTDHPPAPAAKALEHFQSRLAFETDCADVQAAFESGDVDFVLLHVVGSTERFEDKHIPNALHVPHRLMTEERMAEWPESTLFVVYCAGPHCNGADRAAAKLAALGRPVKVMIGGITGWEDEGYKFSCRNSSS